MTGLAASIRSAMLNDGMGFNLVPWQPMLEKHLGQTLANTARGNSVSLELGRKKRFGV